MTIHAGNTVRLFDEGKYPGSPLARRMRTEEVCQASKASRGMISIDRDNLSQVFYGTDYFTRMAGSMFEVVFVWSRRPTSTRRRSSCAESDGTGIRARAPDGGVTHGAGGAIRPGPGPPRGRLPRACRR